MAGILEAKQLCFSYGTGKPVLRGLTFGIKKGQRVAVLGPNGSGKSTLFALLNGLREPESGEIWYEGKPAGGKAGLRLLRRHVGYVFQEADHQIVAPTVETEISFGPMNLELPAKEVRERVEEAIAGMGLADCRDRPPHYLSGGEKKRVSIADILAMRPEVLLFDEPAASLDPLNEELLEKLLEQLSAQGKTLLISTHNVDFAYRFAERILVLEAGQVLADGPPEEIFAKEEVLKRAHLKKPLLWEVCRILRRSGKMPGRKPPDAQSGREETVAGKSGRGETMAGTEGRNLWPKSIEAFERLFAGRETAAPGPIKRWD